MTYEVEAYKTIIQYSFKDQKMEEFHPIQLDNTDILDGKELLKKKPQRFTHFIVNNRHTDESYTIFVKPIVFDKEYAEKRDYIEFANELRGISGNHKKWEDVIDLFTEARFDLSAEKPVCFILANEVRHFPEAKDMILNADGKIVPVQQHIRPEDFKLLQSIAPV